MQAIVYSMDSIHSRPVKENYGFAVCGHNSRAWPMCGFRIKQTKRKKKEKEKEVKRKTKKKKLNSKVFRINTLAECVKMLVWLIKDHQCLTV